MEYKKQIKGVNKMKLTDLKQGMICELRSGNKLIMIDNERCMYSGGTGIYDIAKYHRYDLTSNSRDKLDIIKVMHSNGEIIYTRPEKVSKWFVPKRDEMYFWVSDNKVQTNYNNSRFDEVVFNSQQVFRTEKEAKAHLLFMQAETTIKKWIAENDDVVLDWNERDEKKHFPLYCNSQKKLYVEFNWQVQYLPKSMYLSSKKLTEQLIKECEKELLIYFGEY